MADDDNPKGIKINKRRLLGIVFSAASLILFTYVAITLISGRELGLARLIRWIRPAEYIEPVDDFYFDVGRNRVFADLGDSVAAAGSLGVQVFNKGGAETVRDPFRMSSPALSATEGRAVAFDIGGTSVRSFTESQICASVEASGAVVSASINRNGWFAVCTQDSGAYKSLVTVYNDTGQSAYRVSLASGYTLNAGLSPDNKKLAVLNMTDNGSKIILYDLGNEEPDGEFVYPGGLILDIRYLPGGQVLAVTMNSLVVVDKDGSGTVFFSFDGRRLGGYILIDSLVVLHLYDFGVGYGGRLITLDESGRLLGGVVTDRAILSMSTCGKYLAVLKSDGPVLYDTELSEFPPLNNHEAAAGATQVISLGDSSVLAAGDHFATVLRIGEGAEH